MAWAIWVPDGKGEGKGMGKNRGAKAQTRGKGSVSGQPVQSQSAAKGNHKGAKANQERKEHVCQRCGIRGHLENECPLKTSGSTCQMCGHKGHCQKMCTTPTHKFKKTKQEEMQPKINQGVDKGHLRYCPIEKCGKSNYGSKQYRRSWVK